MILSGTMARGTRIERAIFTGDLFAKTTIVEGDNSLPVSPNAFLVEQRANVVLPPHFHRNNQFQLVVRGSGRLGRSHRLEPVTLHYAHGNTGYGPITAGPQGLQYLTLRRVVETGAYYLPQSRAELDMGRPKFQTSSDCHGLAAPADLAAIREPAILELLPPAVSGLGGWLLTIPAGTALRAPDLPHGSGRFHVVCGGSIAFAGESLPERACVWTSADEPGFTLQAEAAGAQVVVVQFPEEERA